MKKEKQILIAIIDDRLWRSIARDTYSFGTLIAVTAIGFFLNIPVLEWMGGILWIVMILTTASRVSNDSRMTVEQARKYLEEME